MSISVLQESAVDNAASSQTTIVANVTGVTAKSSLHVIVITNHFYTINGVASSVSGSFTHRGTDADDTTSSRKISQWTLDNVAAGSHTLTATFSSSVNGPGTLVWREIGAASGFHVAANGNVQAAPGVTVDAVVSGAATNTAQPALLSALAFDATSNTTPATGTGFTSGQGASSPSTGGALRTESKRITATGSNTATFTAGAGSDRYMTVMAIFLEAGNKGARYYYDMRM